jgi:hypothetical protein
MAEDRTKAPTVADLAGLSRYGCVAIAVRCAQRVAYLFLHSWPDAPSIHVEAVHRAIERAASLARFDTYSCGVRDDRETPQVAAMAAGDASAYIAQQIAYIADQAFHTAFTASDQSHHDDDVRGMAADVAQWTGPLGQFDDYSGGLPGVRAGQARVEAMWRDVDLLRVLTIREQWSRWSLVDPDVLGPLWPNGLPADWPQPVEQADGIGGFTINFEVPDDVSDAEAFERINEYVKRLNSLHRAMGGKGLRIAPPAEVLEPVRICAGVGS